MQRQQQQVAYDKLIILSFFCHVRAKITT